MVILPLPFPLSNYSFIETIHMPQTPPKYGVRGSSPFINYWICLKREVTEWISENMRDEVELDLHPESDSYAIAFSSEYDAILFKMRWW